MAELSSKEVLATARKIVDDDSRPHALCAKGADPAGYGGCVLRPGHDGAHVDAMDDALHRCRLATPLAGEVVAAYDRLSTIIDEEFSTQPVFESLADALTALEKLLFERRLRAQREDGATHAVLGGRIDETVREAAVRVAKERDALRERAELAEGRVFPVMLPNDRQVRAAAIAVGARAWVPWGLVAANKRQCLANHGMDHEGLAARGGMSIGELACVLDGRKYVHMHMEEAARIVNEHVARFQASLPGTTAKVVEANGATT